MQRAARVPERGPCRAFVGSPSSATHLVRAGNLPRPCALRVLLPRRGSSGGGTSSQRACRPTVLPPQGIMDTLRNTHDEWISLGAAGLTFSTTLLSMCWAVPVVGWVILIPL